MAVIATLRPPHQATPPPSAKATTANPRLIGRLGRAAALTSNAYRKLANTATAMPIPATKMPEGAVTGDDMRCRPYRKRKAAARSGAPMPVWEIRVKLSASSMFLCVDGLHRTGLAMCAVPRRVPAGLEHREHAVGDGIAARCIAGTEQHGNEANHLLLHRTRVQQRIDSAHYYDAVHEIRA